MLQTVWVIHVLGFVFLTSKKTAAGTLRRLSPRRDFVCLLLGCREHEVEQVFGAITQPQFFHCD
ncbi:hypothetical protein, partial [Thiolapillus sp.]|uniref:hypothetical protein n=1 Tax=Thiolapillus sp. TaxID=2017437 RepID=UPI003AF84AF9